MGGAWKQWLATEGPFFIFAFVWLMANVGVFLANWYKYNGDQFAYLRVYVNSGLQVARGAANILNLNSALILFPVCRNLINFTRGLFESKRTIRRLFDKNILFHKWCAYMICFACFLHIGAHLFNVQNLVNCGGCYEPNVRTTDSWNDVLATIPGFTGILVTAALILMVSTAVEQIRRSFFELFWYTHHFFILYYVALCCHGISGFVRKQVVINGQVTTVAGGPQTFEWLVGPLAVYVCERLYRLYMSQFRPLKIVKVVKHHDKSPVIEVRMQKIPTKAGQYVFLHCPEVSQIEWHPFTLTSCPELDTISVHVRLAGDWTGAFAERCGFNCITFKLADRNIPKKKDVMLMLRKVWPSRRVNVVHVLGDSRIQHTSDDPFSTKDVEALQKHSGIEAGSVTTKEPLQPHLLPSVAIDGPFGTCSEDVYHFDVSVLVGAGIGVTPFASILQSLYFRLCNPSQYAHSKTKKVYFYWICPGFDAWSWFASLLMDIEEKLLEIGQEDFLDIRVYMTRGWTDDDAARLILQDREDGDLIVRDEETGRALRHKMNFGRPMWERDFAGFAANHPGANVGVFFCGPKILSTQLHDQCRVMNAEGRGRFFYHKENF